MPPPPEPPIGVLAGVGRGWSLLCGDLRHLWVVGMLAHMLQVAVGMLGAATWTGGIISIAAAVFIQPPLQAGLAYAVARRAGGLPGRFEDLFEGFRQRYWQSVITILPPTAIGVAALMILAGLIIVAVITGIAVGAGSNTGAIVRAVIAVAAVAAPLFLLLFLGLLFFVFSLVAVWDHPESGWAAVEESARLVKGHFFSVLGLALLFIFINLAAVMLGILACCVGVLFTVPFVTVWHTATLIHLYKSWTGRSPGVGFQSRL